MNGTATGAGADEKPSAVAGSQDVHGTGTDNDEIPPFAGSQDASGRENAAWNEDKPANVENGSDAPRERACP